MGNSLRTYHIASAKDKDSDSPKQRFIEFAGKHDFEVGVVYIEPAPLVELKGSQLSKLLNSCQHSDVVLIEDTTVFDKLNSNDWEELAYLIRAKKVRMVVIDIPTTWQHMVSVSRIEDIGNTLNKVSLTSFMIEVLASRSKSSTARIKQAQADGIKKAKQKSKYEGRKPDIRQYKAILKLLDAGKTYKEIEKALRCSSRTVSVAKKWQETKLAKMQEDKANQYRKLPAQNQVHE